MKNVKFEYLSPKFVTPSTGNRKLFPVCPLHVSSPCFYDPSKSFTSRCAMIFTAIVSAGGVAWGEGEAASLAATRGEEFAR
jgi:hypothetical protein